MTNMTNLLSNNPYIRLLSEMKDDSLFYPEDDTPKKLQGVLLEPVRTEAKIQRNQPCPCGSGKKYKKCCINL